MQQELARDRLATEARGRLEEMIAQHDPMGKLIAWSRRARREATRKIAVSAASQQHKQNRAPSRSRKNDLRIPAVGSWITRQYQGREISVRVLDDGFEFEGNRFRSLSAIAKRVTGAHWNGYLFFGITRQEK